MKKRSLILFAGILVVAAGIFVAGWKTRQRKEKTAPTPDSTEAPASQGTTGAEGIQTTSESGYSQEELDAMAWSEDALQQQQEDMEYIKQNGNIWEEGEYVSFGGFGYEVSGFTLYDTYEEVKEIPDYDTEAENGIGATLETFDIAVEATDYSFVTVKVTNETKNAKILYTSSIGMEAVREGMRSWSWEEEGTAGLASGGEPYYVDGVYTSPTGDEGRLGNAVIQPGESITLTLGFRFSIYTYREGGNRREYLYHGLNELPEKPDYYIGISGSLQSGEYVSDIREEKNKVFIHCIPKE